MTLRKLLLLPLFLLFAACGGQDSQDGASLVPTAPAASAVSTNGRLKVCGNHICSASGTQVQLKGMSWFWSNTGWGAERFYNSTAVASVAGWGGTVVRAAVGVEGTGGYLESSTAAAANLARATTLIDAAIANGVYVLVDWHYSSNALYQSQAQSFFQQLAQKYASSPNIIWEPFNEPTSNSWSSLKSYHTAIINTIRAAGSQNLVVAGNPTWSQDVDVAAADPLADTNTAYTLHFYAGTHGQSLRDKANTAMSRGVAVFVTEWGTVDASGNGNYNPTESTNWTNWMDTNKISSANWSLNDKAESASALVSGGSASATGPWPDAQLTQSGLYVKAYISKNSPPPTTFALTVTRAGSGTGTVTSNTGGISCGSTCSASYNSGTVVTLTATAASGSTFAGWGGSCSGTATTCAVTMSAARSVTATFNGAAGTFALTVTKAGTGTGTVSSNTGGISCGSTCSASYTSGTVVTLTAAAASGSTFGGWGGSCSGTAATCAVTMSAARSVTATFNTSGGGTGGCHVTYSITNSWGAGFQGAFSIQNTSSTAWTSWTLTWTFPGGQTITQLWNGTATQSGAAVTVKNLSYNGNVAANATVSGMGFTANGAAATPSSFAVNGVTCN